MENGIPRVLVRGATGEASANARAKTDQAARGMGILLVGHGTRSEQGISDFFRVAYRVSRLSAPPVAAAFLELCQPTIQEGLGQLIERGADHVVVAPLLLFAAGHARRDIPDAVSAAIVELGAADRITTVMAAHLGCHPAIVELSARRFTESLQGRQSVPAAETCLLLVGRGSLDPSATAQMHELAQLRSQLAPVAETRVAFLAMAQPAIADVLSELAACKWRRIVVQPHLLLHGELYEDLLAQVENRRRDDSMTEWVVTSYLAGSSARDPAVELVTEAVLDRANEAARIRVVAPGGDR